MVRPACFGAISLHQSCAVSVPLMTKPDGVRLYCLVIESGGEYACTLTATELAEQLRTSCACRGPNDRTAPEPIRFTRTAPPSLGTTLSSRSPQTMPNAPFEPPWSWKPV